MKKPNTKQRKKVIISSQSILVKFGLSTIVTVIKTNNGPQAIHSPHKLAGEATFKTSIHTPPQFQNAINTFAVKPIDTICKAISNGIRVFVLPICQILKHNAINIIPNPPKLVNTEAAYHGPKETPE